MEKKLESLTSLTEAINGLSNKTLKDKLIQLITTCSKSGGKRKKGGTGTGTGSCDFLVSNIVFSDLSDLTKIKILINLSLKDQQSLIRVDKTTSELNINYLTTLNNNKIKKYLTMYYNFLKFGKQLFNKHIEVELSKIQDVQDVQDVQSEINFIYKDIEPDYTFTLKFDDENSLQFGPGFTKNELYQFSREELLLQLNDPREYAMTLNNNKHKLRGSILKYTICYYLDDFENILNEPNILEKLKQYAKIIKIIPEIGMRNLLDDEFIESIDGKISENRLELNKIFDIKINTNNTNNTAIKDKLRELFKNNLINYCILIFNILDKKYTTLILGEEEDEDEENDQFQAYSSAFSASASASSSVSEYSYNSQDQAQAQEAQAQAPSRVQASPLQNPYDTYFKQCFIICNNALLQTNELNAEYEKLQLPSLEVIKNFVALNKLDGALTKKELLDLQRKYYQNYKYYKNYPFNVILRHILICNDKSSNFINAVFNFILTPKAVQNVIPILENINQKELNDITDNLASKEEESNIHYLNYYNKYVLPTPNYFKAQGQQNAGAKRKYTKTDKYTTYKNRKYRVYTGMKGGKYIKVQNEFKYLSI
jgi:hypothetical protein